MAQAAPRPCRRPGCGALGSNGYCDQHQADRIGWLAPQRGNSAQRGYGHRWRRLRELVLIRDGGLCCECKRHGRTTVATDVDHVISKAAGGTDDESNLQSLCPTCHKAKTAAEAAAAR